MPLPAAARALAADRLAALAERPADQPAGATGVQWLVLGPPRLHATLVTGEVLSKTAAGAYAARLVPAHAGLIERCVAARAGADVAFTTPDGLAAAALARAVIADALTASAAAPS